MKLTTEMNRVFAHYLGQKSTGLTDWQPNNAYLTFVFKDRLSQHTMQHFNLDTNDYHLFQYSLLIKKTSEAKFLAAINRLHTELQNDRLVTQCTRLFTAWVGNIAASDMKVGSCKITFHDDVEVDLSKLAPLGLADNIIKLEGQTLSIDNQEDWDAFVEAVEFAYTDFAEKKMGKDLFVSPHLNLSFLKINS